MFVLFTKPCSVFAIIRAFIERDLWEMMANSCAEFVWCFSHRLELALKDALSEWMNPIATNKSSKNTGVIRDIKIHIHI